MSRCRFYQKSEELSDFRLFDDSLLFDGKSIHQPSVLLHGDGLYFGLIPRPAEFSVRKPFVEKQETIALIKKCFYPVSPSSAEKENAALIGGIQLKFLFYNCSKTINAAA